MRTFKSYITEVAWRESLSTSLFDLPRAGLSDVKIPISPSIFKRIFPKSIRSTVFHVTDFDGIAKLKKIQGKKSSISAFYNMSTEMINYGIQTEGGYVVELEGDILVAGQDDLASAPDKAGRRWLTLSTIMNSPDDYDAGLGGKTKLKGMEKDIEEMMKTIVIKFQEPDDRKFLPDVNKSWIHLRRELESGSNHTHNNKLLSMVIKDYIDGMEKIMKKYSKKLAPLFTNYTKKRTLKVDPDSGDTPQWDELIVNNFTIKKVHVSEIYAEDFEGDDDMAVWYREKLQGLPFQIWDEDSKLSKYIAKIVKKGK
tara:strand:- start:77 stop:1009 length:933 start_codon:yes stop_codon:yes gene_type:complete